MGEAERTRITEIADYMKRNPSLIVGLDGHVDPLNRTRSLNRVNAVRDQLVLAGLPAWRIEMGTFGDPMTRRDGRVEVLFRTAR